MPEFQISEATRRTLQADAWTYVKRWYREQRIWKPRWLKIAEAEALAKVWEQALIKKEQEKHAAAVDRHEATP